MSRTSRALLIATSLLLAAGTAASAPSQPDVRVLIDVSGSMKDNDPANLRVPALHLLVGLLPAHARAGIWTFAQSAERQIAAGSVDDTWKQRAGAAADAIHSRGQLTDIETALRAATEGWETEDTNSRRSLILLTDGMVDTGSDTASRDSRSRILEQRVAALERSGAAVHAIALSAHADHELLEHLAIATGGWYERADDAGQLERLFLRMFEKATQPDTVPISGNRFSVDNSIDEMTVLVFREEEAPPMRLLTPDGSALVSDDAGDETVHWRAGSGYDMVTVQAPATGDWHIEGEVDPDNRVMVVTDLRLEVAALPSHVVPGTDLLVEASLSEGGKPMQHADFLRLVGMSTVQRTVNGDELDLIMMDDGEAGDIELGDGTFSVTIAGGEHEGVMHVDVIADSGTFIREQRQSVNVLWPATAHLEAGDNPALLVTPHAALLEQDSLEVQASFAPLGGSAVSLQFEPDDTGVQRARLVDIATGGSITVSVQGRTVSGQAVSLTLPDIEVEPSVPRAGSMAIPEVPLPATGTPEPPPEPEPLIVEEDTTEAPPTPVMETPAEQASPWGVTLAVAGAANLLLVLLAGAIWWWRRRRTGTVLQDFESALAPAA